MKNLTGSDASIEVSLKEYGFAWEAERDYIRFYYGVVQDGINFTLFDWTDMDNDLDVCEEYDSVDFERVANSVGMSLGDWENLSLVEKIQDMASYCGTEDIYGSLHFELMTYEEVVK